MIAPFSAFNQSWIGVGVCRRPFAATLPAIDRSNSFGEDMIAIRKSPALLLLMLGFFALAWLLARTEEPQAQDDRLKEIIAAMFRALKPGGVLGLVQHRGDPNAAQDPKAGSGYVNEDYVIELAKKAGFELAEKSEINANPKDTKDYPKGVWTLPPSLRLGDEDREKYLAIGE